MIHVRLIFSDGRGTESLVPLHFSDDAIRAHFSSATQVTCICRRPLEAPYSVLREIQHAQIRRMP